MRTFFTSLDGQGTGRAGLCTVTTGLAECALPVFAKRCFDDVEHTGLAQCDRMSSAGMRTGVDTTLAVDTQLRTIA